MQGSSPNPYMNLQSNYYYFRQHEASRLIHGYLYLEILQFYDPIPLQIIHQVRVQYLLIPHEPTKVVPVMFLESPIHYYNITIYGYF